MVICDDCLLTSDNCVYFIYAVYCYNLEVARFNVMLLALCAHQSVEAVLNGSSDRLNRQNPQFLQIFSKLHTGLAHHRLQCYLIPPISVSLIGDVPQSSTLNCRFSRSRHPRFLASDVVTSNVFWDEMRAQAYWAHRRLLILKAGLWSLEVHRCTSV